ncbi:MAG: hypothetical protein RIT81_05800 [Deltaproteobacteria bacterium]
MMQELVGGIDLSATNAVNDTLKKMLSNAEYWLSFDVANFETLLAKSPSPLRELGVAIALRFSEKVNGELTSDDIRRARDELLEELTQEVRNGIDEGLGVLERAVRVRDRVPELERDGFRSYEATSGLSVHALRAMGKSIIEIEGHDKSGKVTVNIGEILSLTATDERGRSLPPPEIDSRIGAPMLVKDEEDASRRSVVFLVPGEYVLRVPGRASGERKVLAT